MIFNLISLNSTYIYETEATAKENLLSFIHGLKGLYLGRPEGKRSSYNSPELNIPVAARNSF